MGRHSSDTWVKLTARVPRGQQGFWDLMRQMRRFSVRDVEQRSCVEKQTVHDYIKRLAKAGYIAADGQDERGATVYELKCDQPDAPSLKRDGSPAKVAGLANEQMWRTMAMLDRFTHRDLAVAASTDQRRISSTTARDYCHALQRAGYLAVIEGGRPRHPAVYKLLKSKRTGPLAPQIQKTKFVFDPNTGEVAGHGEPMGGRS
jgi:hypothetical protein